MDADDENRVDKMCNDNGAALLNAVGPERMEIFYNFGVDLTDIRNEDFYQDIEVYCARSENKTILTHMFLSFSQREW